MAFTFAHLLVVLAAALCVHAGYSNVHYRNLLALQTDSPPHETPADVVIELAVVMVVGLFGALLIIGKLPLLLSSVNDVTTGKPGEPTLATSGFKVLNHRGPAVARLLQRA